MRERIFGRAEERTRTSPDMPTLLSGLAPGGPVTPHNALAIADVFGCVRVLADAAASVPLIAYRRTSGGRERVEGGRAVELLERPGPGTVQANLLGTVMAHLQLWGNAYIGKVRQGGEIRQLIALEPDRVVPEVKDGRLRFNYTAPAGRRQVLTERDVIHVKAVSVDGLVGLSPVKQARRALALSDQLTRHGLQFFTNDARPTGVLKLQKFAAEGSEIDELREAWNTQHAGTENAHRIAVLAGEVDFTPISMPLDDAQFIEQRKLSAVEVARIFRVPPWMIGADSGGSMTYSNVESQALAFVTYSLRPWLVAIEQAISNDGDLFTSRQYVEFLIDSLLRADSKTRAEVYRMALDPERGWMTRAEVRQRENLEPEPVADSNGQPRGAQRPAAVSVNGEGS